jgi:hypothetical protein
MRHRRRVDRNHSEIRAVLRSLCPAVEDLSDVGRGVPDLLVRTRAGTVLLVEVKDGEAPPSRQRLTPDEAAFANRWTSAYVIVSTVDEAIAASRR